MTGAVRQISKAGALALAWVATAAAAQHVVGYDATVQGAGAWSNNALNATQDCTPNFSLSPYSLDCASPRNAALWSAGAARVLAGMTPVAPTPTSDTTFQADFSSTVPTDLAGAIAAGTYADFPFTTASPSKLAQFGYRRKASSGGYGYAIELVDGAGARFATPVMLKTSATYTGAASPVNELLNFDVAAELAANTSYRFRVYFFKPTGTSGQRVELDDFAIFAQAAQLVPGVSIDTITLGGFAGPFDYSLSGAAPALGSVSTTAAGTATALDPNPATPAIEPVLPAWPITDLVITQSAMPAGWLLDAVQCTRDGVAVGTLNGSAYTILAAEVTGTQIHCTFTNRLPPSPPAPVATPVPVLDAGALLLAAAGLGGLGAWRARRQTSQQAGLAGASPDQPASGPARCELPATRLSGVLRCNTLALARAPFFAGSAALGIDLPRGSLARMSHGRVNHGGRCRTKRHAGAGSASHAGTNTA